MIKDKLTRPIVFAAALAIFSGGVVAFAEIPNSGTNEVHLCYQKRAAKSEKGGSELRIYDNEVNPGACLKGDREIAINQRGPTGPRGATGAQGPTGPRGATGTRGATGAQGNRGATGAQGSPGAAGTSTAFFAAGGTIEIGGNPGTVTVISKTVPAGNYLITFKSWVFNGDGGDRATIRCDLRAGGGGLDTTEVALTPTLDDAFEGTLGLQGAVTGFAGGAIDVVCQDEGPSNAAQLYQNKLTAIQVNTIG